MIIKNTIEKLPGTQVSSNTAGYDEDRDMPSFTLGKAPPIPHPKWAELNMLWSFLSASYDGGSAYKKARDSEGEEVFIPHEHESTDSLKRRRRISCYRNFCKPICDKFNDMIFSIGVRRDMNPAYQAWIKNVSDCGLSMQDFMKQVALKACILGRYFVCIDSSAETEGMTQAQAMAAGVEISLRLIHPSQIIDWEDNGSWFLLRESPKEYKLVDETNITEVSIGEDGMVKTIETQPHGWVDCPIIMVNARCDKRSLISDVAELAKCVFNSDSILREELYKQTFSQWWAIGVKADDLAASNVGSRKVICVNPEGRAASDVRFERMSGDASQAESIRQTIEMDVREIFRSVGLKPPDIEQTSPESGRALRIRNSDVTSIAASIADEARKAEIKINNLYTGASQMEIEEPLYPSSADLEQDDASIQLAETLQIVSSTLPIELKTIKTMKYLKADFPDLDTAKLLELERRLNEQAQLLADNAKLRESTPTIITSDVDKEQQEHPLLDRSQAKLIAEQHKE
jgi:hypothetical protein